MVTCLSYLVHSKRQMWSIMSRFRFEMQVRKTLSWTECTLFFSFVKKAVMIRWSIYRLIDRTWIGKCFDNRLIISVFFTKQSVVRICCCSLSYVTITVLIVNWIYLVFGQNETFEDVTWLWDCDFSLFSDFN